MRFNLIGLLLLAVSQLVWSAAKIDTWQTPQGSRIYYVHTAGLPMADVRVVFDAGSARDEGQFGVGALTSALLDSGAGGLSADDIAQRFESVGAQYSAGVSEDMAWLEVRTLTEKALFDKALATFETVLSKPDFNEADFQREKARTLAGLKHREESPAETASIAFNKALYGEHPYAHPETGIIETVAGFSAENLKNFYQKYYVAANAIVVIVGDLSREQAEQTAKSLLSKLPTGGKPAEIPQVIMPDKATTQHIEFPSTQTHVLVGLPGTYRKDPDYFALYVGNHILGGGGMVSRLFEEVREKRGLAYGAYSVFAPMYRQGPFMMSLQTRNDQTEQALGVLRKTFDEFLDKGPTEKELTASKRNITGGFAMRFDTNSKLTDYVAMIGFYQQPLDYLDTFQAKVEAVTTEQIRDAFKRRVKPELLQTVTVGASK